MTDTKKDDNGKQADEALGEGDPDQEPSSSDTATEATAQAIAQVCELTWQIRGQAEGRQVEGARAGITVNQGLFGHGSSVICTA